MSSSETDVNDSWWKRNIVARKRRPIVVGLTVAALVLPVAAWAGLNQPFNDMKPGTKASRDVTEVADAGLMTGFADGGFHPYAGVNRVLLARTLHNALPRISLTSDISAFPTTDDENERAIVGSISIDGYFRGSQEVVVNLNMEVSSTGITSDCTTHLQVLSQPENFRVGRWNFTMSPGSQHRSVSATFAAPQPTGSAYTYALFGYTDCPNPVTVDQGVLSAQTFPFDGLGNAYEAN